MTRTLTLLSIVLALLAGCGDAGTGAGEATGSVDGAWVLRTGTGPDGSIELVDGHVPTLTVDGEEWGGTVCNHYGATVVSEGSSQVRVGDVFQTEMVCLADGAMEAEAAYLEAFTAITSYERAGDQLVLRGPDVELVYGELAPEADAELEGTQWRLDAVVAGSGPDGAVSSVLGEPTLELGDGQLTGHTGCNGFEGSYEVEGDRLHLSQLVSTRIGCEDALAVQEAHVLGVLGSSPTVRVEGPALELTAEDGQGLVYRTG
jgi:heat shock protein HslJ